MSKKNEDGIWEWDEEDEKQISMAEEARVRASRRLSAEKKKEEQDARCKEGKHATIDKDGKCSHCREKPQAPPPQRKKGIGLSF